MTKLLRFTLAGLLALLLLAALATAALLATALQRTQAVAPQQAPDQNDVARALTLLRLNDPRNALPGVIRTVDLTERDLDVLLNHAAARRVDAITRVTLQQGQALVQSSVHVPAGALGSVFGRWLNLQVRVAETGKLPAVVALHAGSLPVPRWLGEWLALRLLRDLGVGAELQVVTDVLQRVHLAPQRLTLVYAWRDDSIERMVAALVPLPEQQRMRAYADRLAELTRQQRGGTTSLAPLLGPMFALARDRSVAAGGDAAANAAASAAENRAAIVVLMLFANGRGVEALLPTARGWPQARLLQVTLAGRDDFPKHWLVSAALAAEGSGPLSKAIGIYKEVADSHGGSGFSFNDIGADRAGTRAGELAMQAPRRLQDRLAKGVREADVMPRVDDLPEFMTEADFLQRYGGIGAPAYNAMLAEIDRRVDRLPLWQ